MNKEKGILGFDELHAKLAPTYEQVETKRKELLGKVRNKVFLWCGITAAVSLGVTVALKVPVLWTLFIVFILTFIVYTIVIRKSARAFSGLYKSDVIGEFVRHLIEEGSYVPDDGISENVFCKCGLFSTIPDRYGCEDLISGRIGKTQIWFSEVHAEEKHVTTDSDGNREERWRDIFRGVIFVGDFNKNFNGRTVVSRNTWLKLGRNKNRVRLEDPEFEKVFDVYADDQIEARYLLTPAMMNRLKELDRKFKGKGVTVSFWDSNVVIAVNDKVNYFEASIWRKANNEKTLRREYEMISAFADIVHDLNLNMRIWQKE